jgi:hypothetical protein
MALIELPIKSLGGNPSDHRVVHDAIGRFLMSHKSEPDNYLDRFLDINGALLGSVILSIMQAIGLLWPSKHFTYNTGTYHVIAKVIPNAHTLGAIILGFAIVTIPITNRWRGFLLLKMAILVAVATALFLSHTGVNTAGLVYVGNACLSAIAYLQIGRDLEDEPGELDHVRPTEQ